MSPEVLYGTLIVAGGTALPAAAFAWARAPLRTWLLAVVGYLLFWISLSLGFIYHPSKNPGPLLVTLASLGTAMWVLATCLLYRHKTAGAQRS